MRVVCKKRNLFQRIWKKIIIVILGACAAAGLMACYPEMKHSEIFAVPVQQETKEAIQTRLEELLENNPEMQDFVDGYENSDGSVTGGRDEEEKKDTSVTDEEMQRLRAKAKEVESQLNTNKDV